MSVNITKSGKLAVITDSAGNVYAQESIPVAFVKQSDGITAFYKVQESWSEVPLAQFQIGGQTYTTQAEARDALALVFPEGSEGGSAALTSATITADGDLSADFNLVDATDGSVTVNLPLASAWANRPIIVKRFDSSGNSVTVNADDQIGGLDSITLDTGTASFHFFSNGETWYITASY